MTSTFSRCSFHFHILPNMSSQSSTSTSFKYFVLADSHAKFIPPVTSTPTHQIIITSISGLKWVDNHQHHLSAIHQLHSPPISNHIASSNAIMLLIGSNSLRVFSASHVLNHVQDLLLALRHAHPHLSSQQSICVVNTFPCGKPSSSFPTPTLLQHNIDLYNTQLQVLSVHLTFTVIDFHVQPQHLSPDHLHIHKHFSYLIPHHIFNYFNILTSSSTTTSPKVISRSVAAIHRRNQRRHLKSAKKQAAFYICRTISPPWTLDYVKTYLLNKQLPFAKLPPIRNNRIRIRFNNALTLQATKSSLPKDFFSSENFSKVFPS